MEAWLVPLEGSWSTFKLYQILYFYSLFWDTLVNRFGRNMLKHCWCFWCMCVSFILSKWLKWQLLLLSHADVRAHFHFLEIFSLISGVAGGVMNLVDSLILNIDLSGVMMNGVLWDEFSEFTCLEYWFGWLDDEWCDDERCSLRLRFLSLNFTIQIGGSFYLSWNLLQLAWLLCFHIPIDSTSFVFSLFVRFGYRGLPLFCPKGALPGIHQKMKGKKEKFPFLLFNCVWK